ncbi:hypothetical protein [Nocardioides sp. GCM10030258]|uniref:hypothetical protein n=1 Tax=unclassified Nocardioides TaxID=2615069 RepID=UPI00361217AB
MANRRMDQRGVTAVLMAVGLTIVVVVSAAFAVDLGQQRVVRRDMQAVADVVALDLVRLLNGGKASAYDKSAFDEAKNRSVSRNDDALGGALTSADVTWDFVKRNGDNWVVIEKTSDEVPAAVKVSATSDTSFAFGGVTGVARGGSTRTAVAQAEESACVRVGSFIASLDTAQSALLNPLLGGLLRSTVNLDLVSYKGLAAANVSLLDLVNLGGLGVGTVDELLALDNLKAGDLLIATAKVLDSKGKLVEANILRSITVGASTPTIAIGDLLNLAPGDSAALGAGINVLDLVTGTAFVANQDHAVAIPNLGISLPGVASVTTSLSVIEAPKPTCKGDADPASTAQIRLNLSAHINGRSLSVPLLNTSVTVAPIDLAISIDLGKAIAQVTKVTCNPTGPESVTVALSSAVVGGVSISANAGIKATVDPVGGLLTNVLGLLGLGSLLKPPYLTLDTSLNIAAGTGMSSTFNKTVVVPVPGGYTTPVGSGTGMLLGAVTVTPAVNTDLVLHYWDGLLILGSWKERHITDPLNSVFTGVLNPIIQNLLSVVLNPLVATLQTALIEPLQDILGLQLGGADVYAKETPTCGGPKLVG